MIAFDEMDARLAALGRKRLWLADVTPYSADYLRTVLAPNSSRRTSRVQQILSDAIEREEQRQGTEKTFGAILPERVTLTCTHHERTQWQQAAVPLPMGWPIGWTDLRPLETAKFLEWQRKHSPSYVPVAAGNA